MSDFFKKAAGLIFNLDDDDTAKKQHQQADDPEKDTPATVSPMPAPISTPIHPDSALTEKFSAYFKDLYDRSNIQGPDFYEFNNMTEAMGNVIADEVKYPSVFAGFGGALTKDKLLTSAQQYLGIIQNDAVEFEHSFLTAVKSKVEDRRAQIQSKADDIRKMQEQIAALNSEIAELNKLAQEEEIRLSSEKAAYEQQSAALQARINAGMEKVKKYIR
ncbi:hypothetical protein ACTHGU_12800 [Chitinophagaceae bacterium MMS25-I14]